MDKWTGEDRQLKNLKKETLELFEALKELKKEKLELSEAFLEELEAINKAMEDVSGLHDIILERQLVIDSLWSRKVQNIKEKFELREKVRQLELNSQHSECVAEDL